MTGILSSADLTLSSAKSCFCSSISWRRLSLFIVLLYYTRAMAASRVVILVGHGGIPTDCPPAMLAGAKRDELSERLRDWPRTAENDPYKPGLEAVAQA